MNKLIKNRGFTMTELITVIVIIGIMGAIALPRFFERGSFDSRGFYDQTISTLRYAQKAAIAQHRFVCVSFPANNSLTLTYGTANTCVDGTLVNPSGTPYPIINSNATYSSYPVGGFYFDALGKPSAAQDIVVNVYGAHIIVEAETGYVH
jgi:MSHA pilin protein MshC